MFMKAMPTSHLRNIWKGQSCAKYYVLQLFLNFLCSLKRLVKFERDFNM